MSLWSHQISKESSPRSLPKVKPFLSCWFLGAAQAEQCLGVCSVSPAFRAGCPLRGLWVKLRDHLYCLPISFRTETCVSSWCHIMSRSSPLSRALFGLSLPALPGWAGSCTCSTGRDCSRELFLGTALLCSGLLWDPAASVCVECPPSKTQVQREGSFGICMYSTKVGRVDIGADKQLQVPWLWAKASRQTWCCVWPWGCESGCATLTPDSLM